MNVTTPSNYFHAIRQQIKLNYRKPLFLYRNEHMVTETISDIEEFKGEFQPVIAEEIDSKTKKIVFCHGEFYFDILKERNER